MVAGNLTKCLITKFACLALDWIPSCDGQFLFINIVSYLSGQQITGDLVLIVSDKISPLEPLDIFLQLNYQNLRGDDKLNTTHKPSPPFVAGVPGFSLKLNNSTNQIRIGGRAKFSFNILMRRIVSTLKVEVGGFISLNFTVVLVLIT